MALDAGLLPWMLDDLTPVELVKLRREYAQRTRDDG